MTSSGLELAGELVAQSDRFGQLIAHADLDVPVPTCPGWSLRQLLRHVGRGDWWAAQLVRDRADTYLDPRAVVNGKPPDDIDGALKWLHDGVVALIDAVGEVGPRVGVWTFLGTRPASWWIRRRLHEVVVHRADAAIALNAPFAVPAVTAWDGIAEWLDRVMIEQAAATPPPLGPGSQIQLNMIDGALGGRQIVIDSPQRGALSWYWGTTDHPTVVLTGPACDLLLQLVRRSAAVTRPVDVSGDHHTWLHWLSHTPL
jgi:uncharacterized protein (TIGR03083 family)